MFCVAKAQTNFENYVWVSAAKDKALWTCPSSFATTSDSTLKLPYLHNASVTICEKGTQNTILKFVTMKQNYV